MSNSVRRPAVDAGPLWAGGVATAVVASLVAVVGVLVMEGLLNIEMVRPPLIPIGDSFVVRYGITAAVLALLATALAHLLLMTTPRPRSFFSWIVGLATTAGVVIPFALEGTTGGKLATAGVNLVIGLAILSLLAAVMRRTARVAPAVGYPPRPSY